MKQKEWMELFHVVNGREPSQEDILAAVKAGIITNDEVSIDESSVSGRKSLNLERTKEKKHVPHSLALISGMAGQKSDKVILNSDLKQFKKRSKWIKIITSLLVVLLLALVGVGSYAWLRNKSGNIEGTWQLTKWQYYDSNNVKWVDAFQNYHNQNYSYYDFIIVDKDGNYQEDSYTYNDKDKAHPYLSLGSYLNGIYVVNQWDKTIEIDYSAGQYRKKVSQILKTDLRGYYAYLKSADINKDIESAMTPYSYSRHYTVKKDTLTIVTKDSNDRTVSKAVYIKLSPSKAKVVKDEFEHVKKSFEKNYHID